MYLPLASLSRSGSYKFTVHIGILLNFETVLLFGNNSMMFDIRQIVRYMITHTHTSPANYKNIFNIRSQPIRTLLG